MSEDEDKLTPAHIACNRVIEVFNEEMLKLEGDSILSFKFLFVRFVASELDV